MGQRAVSPQTRNYMAYKTGTLQAYMPRQNYDQMHQFLSSGTGQRRSFRELEQEAAQQTPPITHGTHVNGRDGYFGDYSITDGNKKLDYNKDSYLHVNELERALNDGWITTTPPKGWKKPN